MPGYRHRYMYYMTGLPGWMRFGYSPGWQGMPPGAQYLMQSGQLPQFTEFLQQRTPAVSAVPGAPLGWSAPYVPQMTKEQEIALLEQQMEVLEQQLRAIEERMKRLKEEE